MMSGTQPAPDAFVYVSQGKATVFAKAAQAEVPQEAPPKAAQVVQAPEEVPQNAVAAGPMPPSTPPPWRLLPKSLQAGTVVPPPTKVGALAAQTMVPPAAPIVAAGPKAVPLPKPKHVPRVVHPPAHLHKPRVVPPRFPKVKDEPTSAAEVVKDEPRFLVPTSKIGVAEEPPRKLAKFHKMMAVKKELQQVKLEQAEDEAENARLDLEKAEIQHEIALIQGLLDATEEEDEHLEDLLDPTEEEEHLADLLDPYDAEPESPCDEMEDEQLNMEADVACDRYANWGGSPVDNPEVDETYANWGDSPVDNPEVDETHSASAQEHNHDAGLATPTDDVLSGSWWPGLPALDVMADPYQGPWDRV